MFVRHRRRNSVLFGIADAVLAVLAFELAYRTRLALPLEREFYILSPTKEFLTGAGALLLPVVGAWLRVYDRVDAARFPVILRDAFKQCFVAGIAVVLLEYGLRLDLSRPFLALYFLDAWILVGLLRLGAPRLMGWYRRGFGSPYYVIVAGVGERARRIGAQLERSAEYGVRLTGFLAADGAGDIREIALNRAYPVHPLGDLARLLDENVIDEIIFAVDSRRLAELEDVLLVCDEEGVRTRVAVDFFPHVNSDVYLDRLHGTPLLTFSATPHDDLRLMAKRALDLIFAGAALILLAPFMLAVALLVRLSSPGPAIFRQVRCGLNGRRFLLYKFRSMVRDAEERKKDLAHLNEKQTAFKISRDPRVTPLGRVLRRFSIDEWPQLWNVLKGDMSLVGPRPPVPEEVERYARWQRRRLRMRPGLTCLWALNGRDSLDFETWMRRDLEYIDRWSLGLDARILIKTIPQVLIGKGAH